MAENPFDGAATQKILLAERDGTLPKPQMAAVAGLRKTGNFPPAIPAMDILKEKPPSFIGAPGAVLTTPGGRQAAGETAAMLAPVAAAAVTGGASLPVQALAQMGTTAALQASGAEEPSLAQVGISGALPLAGAVAGRIGRGIERTATRMIPSRFRAAQEGAATAAGEVAEQVRPDMAPGALFKGARAGGGDAIPTRNIQLAVKDLNDSIGPSPKNPGLKLVREYTDDLAEASQTGSVDLNRLMQIRLDLGRSLPKSPELGALYGAVIKDLQVASKAGGPGASNALEALKAFKADLGANKFEDMVLKATKGTTAGGDSALNIAKLRQDVAKHHDQLSKLLGPEQLQLILAFTERFKGLPPAQAYTAGNMLVNVVAATAGAVTGGVTYAVGGALGLELMKNAALVGKNPKALNATLTALTEASRAGAVQATRDAE